MTEEDKPKGLEDVLSGLITSDDSSPVDVVKQLLDPTNVVMHTDVKRVGVMNALKVTGDWFERRNLPRITELYRSLYEAELLHRVSEKRTREKVLKSVLCAQMAMLGIAGQEGEKKGGLFGRGR